MNTVNTSVLCRSLAQAVQRLWGLLGDLTEPLGNGPKHLALGIPACVTWHLVSSQLRTFCEFVLL